MSARALDHFADRLALAVARAGSPACVGLDPVLDRLPTSIREKHDDPVEAIEAFCMDVLDAIAGAVGVVKPQSACFERFGAAGFAAMERVITYAKTLGFIVILDAKRGDIGATAEHYAAFAFDAMDADAVTLNMYLGADTVEPYLCEKYADRGVFILVRTSNPGSDAVQSRTLSAGDTVAEIMADHVRVLGADRLGKNGLSQVGAVVAATKPADARALRLRMPEQIFLIPGFGAQGGTVDTVRELFLADGSGAIVTASRSVLYAFEKPPSADWRAAVQTAAEEFADQISIFNR